MLQLPRLAVGSVQTSVDPQPVCWALLALLSHRGQQVQHFHSSARFPRCEGAFSSTGVKSRHLDSWLMTPDLCREVFAHGASKAEISIVEGRYATAHDTSPRGGQLADLCDWLDLPRLVVLDVTDIDNCRLPARPERADGLLLDKVQDAAHFARLQTTLESLWNIPVFGALESLPAVRECLDTVPRGMAPDREVCQALAANFSRYARIDGLRNLAARRAFPCVRPFVFVAPARGQNSNLTVAMAFDEAFSCYYPDALELLELHGASVVDFSPLRDEALPAGTDLVVLGCGHPERYAAALAENHCMRLALREHLCAGRRIYAEGGGLAYLCEHMVTPTGKQVAMVGALPAVATSNPHPSPPSAVEVSLSRKCWLGHPGTRLRGYLNANWHLEPSSKLDRLVREPGHHCDLVGRYLAIGSRLHLNFVSQPEFLQGFLRPAAMSQASC